MQGLGESLLVRGAVDRLVFETFVERVLVPTLRPGHIVVLNNLSVHKSATARVPRGSRLSVGLPAHLLAGSASD
jgi:hypothetical protein